MLSFWHVFSLRTSFKQKPSEWNRKIENGKYICFIEVYKPGVYLQWKTVLYYKRIYNLPIRESSAWSILARRLQHVGTIWCFKTWNRSIRRRCLQLQLRKSTFLWPMVECFSQLSAVPKISDCFLAQDIVGFHMTSLKFNRVAEDIRLFLGATNFTLQQRGGYRWAA